MLRIISGILFSCITLCPCAFAMDDAASASQNTNPMPTNLRAEFVELANSVLDRIPITNEDELEFVKNALRHLLKENGILDTNSKFADLSKRISVLKGLMDEADLYVQNEEHIKEYIAIFKQRIKAKIDELATGEKEESFKHHQAAQNKVAENKAIFAKSSPPIPGSEGHVIDIPSEVLEQLREIMGRFFGDITQLQNRVNQAGFPIKFNFSLGHNSSGIEVQEDQIAHFLEQQFEMPDISEVIDLEDLNPILQAYVLKYVNALSPLGIICDFGCTLQSSQELAHIIVSRFFDRINEITNIFSSKNIKIKFDIKCRQNVENYDIDKLLKLYAIQFQAPQFPEVVNSFKNDILPILDQYLSNYGGALEYIGVIPQISFRLE